MSTKEPNAVDRYVGSRIRMRRLMLGISQEKLGDALNLTFQQVQKYEKGTNRVGSSRLSMIGEALQVPPAFFFEGAPSANGDLGDDIGIGTDLRDLDEFTSSSEGIALAQAFLRLTPKLRRSIVTMVENMAETSIVIAAKAAQPEAVPHVHN